MLAFVFLIILAIWPSYQRLWALTAVQAVINFGLLAMAGDFSPAFSLVMGLAVFIGVGAVIVQFRTAERAPSERS